MGRFTVGTSDIVEEDFFSEQTMSSGEGESPSYDRNRGGQVRTSSLVNPLRSLNKLVGIPTPVPPKVLDVEKVTGSGVQVVLDKMEDFAIINDIDLGPWPPGTATMVMDTIRQYTPAFVTEIINIVEMIAEAITTCAGTTGTKDNRRDLNNSVFASIEIVMCAASRSNLDLILAAMGALENNDARRGVLAAASNEAARRGDIVALEHITAISNPVNMVTDSPDLPKHTINGLRQHNGPAVHSSFGKVMTNFRAYGDWGVKTANTLATSHSSKAEVGKIRKIVESFLPVARLDSPLVIDEPSELQFLFSTLASQ